MRIRKEWFNLELFLEMFVMGVLPGFLFGCIMGAGVSVLFDNSMD